MKKFIIRLLLTLLAIIAFIAALTGIEYFGGQPMGLFAGARPAGLGFNVNAGKFAPPSWKPNCVSSTVDKGDEKHYIAPIAYSADSAEAWKKLVAIVKGTARVNVVAESANYMYAEFKSAGMGFVDDVEFALDEKAGVIQVRSASRLGVRDLGANRARIEAIRAQFGK